MHPILFLSRITHTHTHFIVFSSDLTSNSSKQTSKQHKYQSLEAILCFPFLFSFSFLSSLCLVGSLHHLQDSLFVLLFSRAPFPHIVIAARLHVLRRQVQQQRSLLSLQHRHQPVIFLRRNLLSTALSSPTFPRIISCSKLDISSEVYTFISGAFSNTFVPCFDSSLRLSYTPGRISFSSSGVGRCSSLLETPRECLLLLHRRLLKLPVQLLFSGLQARSHLVYR